MQETNWKDAKLVDPVRLDNSHKACSKCKVDKNISEYHRSTKSRDGHRPDCKDCAKEGLNIRSRIDPVSFHTNRLAAAILKRTLYDIDNPKNKLYRERGVKCLLGSNRRSVANKLRELFEQEIILLLNDNKWPSIDRIDPYGHYEPGNIRMVDIGENIRSAVANSKLTCSRRVTAANLEHVIEFPSVSAAARFFGIKRDTVLRSAKTSTPCRNGASKGWVFSCPIR